MKYKKEKEFGYNIYSEDVCSSEDFILLDDEGLSIGRVYDCSYQFDSLYYAKLFKNAENMHTLLDRLYNDEEHVTNNEIKELLDEIGIKRSKEELFDNYCKDMKIIQEKADKEFDEYYNQMYKEE